MYRPEETQLKLQQTDRKEVLDYSMEMCPSILNPETLYKNQFRQRTVLSPTNV